MLALLFRHRCAGLYRFAGLALVLFWLPVAASAQAGFSAAPKGLLYRIYGAHAGPKIVPGDFISVNLVVRTDGDSLLMSTYQSGYPVVQVVPKSEPGEVQSALLYLTEGDSATVKVNIDSLSSAAKGRMPVKGKYIVYNLKIEKVIARGTLTDTVFNARIKDYMTVQTDALKQAEPGRIKKYAADKGLAVTVTASGLNYVITRAGQGAPIAAGDTAVVWYTARFVNDKLLETNMEQLARQGNIYKAELGVYKPLHIEVGAKRAIPGWDEGLQLLSKGAKATFIMPSALAYGADGFSGAVPPYCPMVFEIEVVDVVRGH